MPSGNQAGVYAAALARLDAVARIGSDDARTAVAEMTRKAPRDRLFGDLTVRPDGRAIHPISPFEV
ncbi:hypothetical protein [Methylobacterium frigidaeris]|uniref:Uncharacterized protein n=1 Tax=Methylobacterium frigidaeris TaxID=2038277 RepID=A0AA37HGY0_9HYPH|nr:hypothetical protein [Methylobacterium frigidaeris]PIK73025.1 hypothetical protein CS379_10715 [Methylobacterium frigidaeris]GJD65673.1 hypothetical protein MPEAHAMD_5868 [Methylobacterium frigidaeris]